MVISSMWARTYFEQRFIQCRNRIFSYPCRASHSIFIIKPIDNVHPNVTSEFIQRHEVLYILSKWHPCSWEVREFFTTSMQGDDWFLKYIYFHVSQCLALLAHRYMSTWIRVSSGLYAADSVYCWYIRRTGGQRVMWLLSARLLLSYW